MKLASEKQRAMRCSPFCNGRAIPKLRVKINLSRHESYLSGARGGGLTRPAPDAPTNHAQRSRAPKNTAPTQTTAECCRQRPLPRPLCRYKPPKRIRKMGFWRRGREEGRKGGRKELNWSRKEEEVELLDKSIVLSMVWLKN